MGRRRNKLYKFSHIGSPPPNGVWLLAFNGKHLASYRQDFYLVKATKWGVFRNGYWKPENCSTEDRALICRVYQSSIAFERFRSSYVTSGPSLFLGENSIIPMDQVGRWLQNEEFSKEDPKEFRALILQRCRLLGQELFARGVKNLPTVVVNNYPEGEDILQLLHQKVWI